MPAWWFWPWGATASAWVATAALLIAMLVDRCFGEPGARWHPVVWMGRYLDWCGRRIAPRDDGRAPQADWPRFRAGAMAWSLGACGVALVAWALQAAVQALPGPVAALLLGLLL
ncbi:MAG: cobalamin biosynthesis protein CobD, partial [Rhodoferax sp.]|nr:cobalamin biosynthesis protein CobD [Rhodoferax sp.]